MIAFLSKHRKTIFIATTATFLVGIFVGLGGYLGSSSKFDDSIAVVGKKSISAQKYYKTLNVALDDIRSKGMDEIPPAFESYIKKEILQRMIVDQIFQDAATDYGIKVPDYEVAMEIQNSPSFRTKDGKFSPELYYRAVWTQLKIKPSEYEAERKSARSVMKVKMLLASAAKVPPQLVKQGYMASAKNPKNFDKESAAYAGKLEEERATALMNNYIKQYISRNQVKDMLEQREKAL